MSDQTEKIIKDFLTEMAAQNRCGTADLFYFTIRSKKSVPAPIYNCEKVCWYLDECYYESKEELVKALKAEHPDKQPHEIEQLIEDEVEEFGVSYIWTEHGMFLTREEADAHLKSNHYHYTHDAHVYAKHAWRAPEQLKFFKALFDHFGIEKQWG